MIKCCSDIVRFFTDLSNHDILWLHSFCTPPVSFLLNKFVHSILNIVQHIENNKLKYKSVYNFFPIILYLDSGQASKLSWVKILKNFEISFNPNSDGRGHLMPPLATLKPHSSKIKLCQRSILIWIWSHGCQLWPRPKKCFKTSIVFELCKLWQNDQN